MRLLFQPAEEGGAGASHMIEEGALGDSEAIFGMHVDYETMTGSIASTFGPLLAAVCFFEAKIEGKRRAHSNVDPILAASSAILALQQLISREADPLDSQVFPFFLILSEENRKKESCDDKNSFLEASMYLCYSLLSFRMDPVSFFHLTRFFCGGRMTSNVKVRSSYCLFLLAWKKLLRSNGWKLYAWELQVISDPTWVPPRSQVYRNSPITEELNFFGFGMQYCNLSTSIM